MRDGSAGHRSPRGHGPGQEVVFKHNIYQVFTRCSGMYLEKIFPGSTEERPYGGEDTGEVGGGEEGGREGGGRWKPQEQS